MGGFGTRRTRPHEAPMPDPLAFFLTWPTYGTWLPGDEWGWVEYRHGFQLPDPVRKLEAQARISEDACVLDEEQRRLVETTIAEHCQIRGWKLHAVNCRSNHLHVVVSADRHPDEIRRQFKAWCTRRLKELETRRLSTSEHTASPARDGLASLARRGLASLARDAKSSLALRVSVPIRQEWWAERGSRRYIGDQESLEAAICYVLDGQ
jgi:hypothetical protein